MRLYLVRHGEATSAEVDPTRPLSKQGERQVRQIAAFIKPLSLCPSAVWHSGKARAEGTARILSSALGEMAALIERKDISPNHPPAPLVAEVSSSDGDLMLVGHLPFLSRLASSLLVGDESREALLFHPGTLACLERGSAGAWRLEWMVYPELSGSVGA